MNSKLKRRLVVVTGVIVVVIVVVLAFVAGATASKTLTVEQAASGSYKGSKIQVTGKVVDNSYATDGKALTFSIYDDAEGADPNTTLKVRYSKSVAATFGNQVTAICTGTIDETGVLICSELVTKCPSKYENSTDALGVSQLLSYGKEVVDKPMKVTGTVKAGTLKPAGQGDRFTLVDPSSGEGIAIQFSDALGDDVQEGKAVVVTGTLKSSGKIEATQVALKG